MGLRKLKKLASSCINIDCINWVHLAHSCEYLGNPQNLTSSVSGIYTGIKGLISWVIDGNCSNFLNHYMESGSIYKGEGIRFTLSKGQSINLRFCPQNCD